MLWVKKQTLLLKILNYLHINCQILRFQHEGEPVEEFITDLQKLAQTCRYCTLMDELIRDRIIIGIQNFKLSERLQTYDNDLTLENTIAKVKAAERVAENQNIVRQESANNSTVANLNQGTFVKKKNFKNKNFN